MKVKSGVSTQVGGASLTPTSSGVGKAAAAAPPPSPSLEGMAEAQRSLGGDKRPPSPIATQNTAALPGLILRYASDDPKAHAAAKFALDSTLAAAVFSAQRDAKTFGGVPARREQILQKLLPGLIGTHHAIAEGYDENLEGKPADEVARRQAFSRALLAEVAQQLWTGVPIDDALAAVPRETLALFAITSDEARASVEARLQRVESQKLAGRGLETIRAAAERGLALSPAENAIIVSANGLLTENPDQAVAMLKPFAERANQYLKKAPAPAPRREDLAALREQIKAAPPPSPEALIAKAEVRIAELRKEIEAAPIPDIEARFRGAMIGLAIGDALGGPTEFMSREAIRENFGIVTDMIGGGWLHLSPGEYTDDTQMAVAMAESITSKGGFDATDLAAHFVDWLNTDPKDVGNLTRRALELARAGADPLDAGLIPWQLTGFENAGNGSVMRSAPIALLTAFGDDGLIADLAMKSSAVTHADPRCTYGTAAISMAVALLMKGQTDVLQKVAAWLKDKSPALSQALLEVPSMPLETVRTSGYVVHTVQAAFWALHHAKDYVDGIVKISNLGEDTDTAGATAGILLGAKFGLEGIPYTWRAQLQNREKLESLADSILKLAQGSGGEAVSQ